MPVTVVSGVTGVGMSSICQTARKDLPEEYTLINFGDSMLEQAAAHDITTNRDELSSVSHRKIRRLQRRAGEFVADRAEGDHILLATHLAVDTDKGFIDGLPDDVLSEISPDLFVVVEAEPALIVDRRDRSDRDIEPASPRTIEFEQHLNRSAALEYARDQNAPIEFVENSGGVNEAATELLEILDDGHS
ncbi:adenylate kinase [Natronomonas sp. F2-12]|uniref:Adenylate kinase n=1 Tax=Natronomonas aquatica TaxID=2841590 RepID=A0A9R1D7T7_9EURY|nr:adenylate kinase [Natronomonas aquatica]MCQ4334555.1 adenylate kinase [Natronomonas aquatica]